MTQAARLSTENGIGVAATRASDDDPLAPVLVLGTQAVRRGLVFGLSAALLMHGAGAARAAASPIQVESWARGVRSLVHDFLWQTYDIEVPKPEKQPEKPPPEEQKADEPAAIVVPVQHTAKAEPDKAPAPSAAQAGKVLTQEPNPDEPVDLTGQGFVSGTAESYAGGVTAANGTSTTAVRQLAARGDGVQGGQGTAPVKAAAPSGPDRSKPAEVAGGLSWNCPFPPEADADQIDFQVVTIVVTVRADGTPQSVKVVQDPGHGFGRAARQCALGQRFSSALDHEGNAILSTTAPIRVRFTR